MLILSSKLESYIINNIIPKLLICPKKYSLSKNFRKCPYITSINITSIVNPEINKDNIFNYLRLLINKLDKQKNNIIINKIICGKFELCHLQWESEHNESIVKENNKIVMQYYINIKSIPVTFNVSFYYGELIDLREKQINLVFEKKFGLQKQLIILIDTYQKLYNNNNLNIDIAKKIIKNIIHDIKFVPYFFSENINEIIEISINNTAPYKMEKWYEILNLLSNDIYQNIKYNLDIKKIDNKIFLKDPLISN